MTMTYKTKVSESPHGATVKPLVPLVSLALLAVLVVAGTANTIRAGDWSCWRGPQARGVSTETGLPDKLDPNGEGLLWTADVGGLANPIVMKGRYYTAISVGAQKAGDDLVPTPAVREALVCLDAHTGREVWRAETNVFQTRVPFHRLAWSGPVGDPQTDRVYILGAQCTLRCLEGATGKPLWERQLTEDVGHISTFGGRTNTPVIDEDQVLVCGVAFGWGDNARGQYRMLALDKHTGAVNWSTPTGGIPVDAPFQTPVVTVVDGVRLVVCAAGDGGVHAWKVRTGEKVWSLPVSKRGLNSSVIADGNRLYVCHGEENLDANTMGRILCLDISGGQPREVWRTDRVGCGYASATLADGKLFVPEDSGRMTCLEAASGRQLWEKKLGTIFKASPVYADGKLYAAEANGRLYVLKPSESGVEVLSRTNVSGKLGREYDVFASPAVSQGRVYVQSANRVYCFGPKDPVDSPTPELAHAAEGPAGAPAFVQVLPNDVALRPGESVAFKVRLFDAKGVPTGFGANPPAGAPAWSIGQLTLQLPGRPAVPIGNLGGAVSDQGVYTAPATTEFQGGAVQVRWGGLSGQARVRVVPPLPWRFDFDHEPAGRAPLTFVGAGGKYEIRKLPDKTSPNGVLVKFARVDNRDTPDAPLDPRYLPLYDQAWTYIGKSDLADYTMTAEARTAGFEIEAAGVRQLQMGDFGVVNSRYALVVLGNHQKLTLHAWPAGRPYSLDRTIPFAVKAGVWYRLKLMVRVVQGKADVRGKVWPRDEAEPPDWTVTLTDELPNLSGCPGLYSFSNKANQVYFDHVTVEPNSPPGLAK